MTATAIRGNNAFEATMNAVVIYDRFDSAVKAKAMLQRAARGTDEHNTLVEDKSSLSVSDMHTREVSLTPTLQRILEQQVSDCWRHGGINE